jgi:MFS family permease
MIVQTLRMAGDEWWRPIPRGVSRDAKLILTARALRAFADGFVSVLLPVYLLGLGFSIIAIGAIVTTTLIGSALLTLWVGIYAHRHKRRLMLLGACGDRSRKAAPRVGRAGPCAHVDFMALARPPGPRRSRHSAAR